MNLKSKKSAPRISDRERRTRHKAGVTVYSLLLAQGFTPEEIQAASDHSDSLRQRKFGVILMDSGVDNSDPLVGVVYTGDFRAEEEYGISELAQALSGPNSDKIAVMEDKGVFRTNLDWHGRSPFDHSVENAVKEARARIRRKEINVGEFHTGATLVMIPDKGDRLAAATLTILFGDSGPAGALRLGGGSSNPFSRSAVFHDERDIPVETMNRVRADEKFHADAMKAIKDSGVEQALRDRGFLMAISKPRPPRDDEGSDTLYWLNYSPRGADQVWGWFTLAELRRIANGEKVEK